MWKRQAAATGEGESLARIERDYARLFAADLYRMYTR